MLEYQTWTKQIFSNRKHYVGR